MLPHPLLLGIHSDVSFPLSSFASCMRPFGPSGRREDTFCPSLSHEAILSPLLLPQFIVLECSFTYPLFYRTANTASHMRLTSFPCFPTRLAPVIKENIPTALLAEHPLLACRAFHPHVRMSLTWRLMKNKSPQQVLPRPARRVGNPRFLCAQSSAGFTQFFLLVILSLLRSLHLKLVLG